MGKASRARQALFKAEQEKINRRTFLNKFGFLAGSLALASGGFVAWDKFHTPSFSEAYNHPEKRDIWLQKETDSRPYVIKQIATPANLADLKAKKDYTPDDDLNVSTIIRDDSKIFNGAESDIYVYEYAFNSFPKNYLKDAGRILTNIINNHELVHADHYHHGIEGFPIEWFLNKDGEIDENMKRILLIQVSEAVAHRAEYDGLTRMVGKNNFINAYQNELASRAKPYFQLAYALSKGNDKMREKIKQTAWF